MSRIEQPNNRRETAGLRGLAKTVWDAVMRDAPKDGSVFSAPLVEGVNRRSGQLAYALRRLEERGLIEVLNSPKIGGKSERAPWRLRLITDDEAHVPTMNNTPQGSGFVSADPIRMEPKPIFGVPEKPKCRWPLGDPRERGFRFCNSPHLEEGKPYCSKHCAVAYQREAKAA